jgi:hypothetical protein
MTPEQQLCIALAKMLPGKVRWNEPYGGLQWLHERTMVQENQLLFICCVVWCTFDRKQRVSFSRNLREAVINSGGHATSFEEDIVACCENATWQQRAEALAKTNGIEL